MCLFQKNTAALPWKRLLVVLYSPSVQQRENCRASSFTALNVDLSQKMHLQPDFLCAFLIFSSVARHHSKWLKALRPPLVKKTKESHPFILRTFLEEQDCHGRPRMRCCHTSDITTCLQHHYRPDHGLRVSCGAKLNCWKYAMFLTTQPRNSMH